MKSSFDKIRILLIDDEPQNLCDEPIWEYPMVMDTPGSSLKFSDVLEVRFLTTTEEAREFRDRSLLLAHSKPETFSRAGWIPEIVVADYMLTGNPLPLEMRHPERFETLSPLHALRKHTSDQLSEAATRMKFKGERIPQDHESYGCFAAGLICNTFSEHPCGLVTRTKRTPGDLEGTYVGYFQWLMANQIANWLQPELPIPREWRDVLRVAMPRLRARILELARQRLIAISLRDLMELESNGEHETLTIESCYGVRRLPVTGLLCDEFPDADRVATEAKDWAGQVLEALVQPCFSRDDTAAHGGFPDAREDLKSAVELAERIWSNGYLNEARMKQRFELATLWNQREEGEQYDEIRLRQLIVSFQLKQGDPSSIDLDAVKEIEDFVEIRTDGFSGLSKRWAALMIIVRLMQWIHEAREVARESDSEMLHKAGFFDGVCAKDVYLALFPISKGPIGLRHQGKSSAASLAGAWGAELQRLNDARLPQLHFGSKKDKNLGLLVEDVLNGEDWLDGGPKGMTPAERFLLQCFALQHGYTMKHWDKQARTFFYGKTGVV